MDKIAFFDLEVDKTPYQFGAVFDNENFCGCDKGAFVKLIEKCQYLCGHNIFEHDLKYIKDQVKKADVTKFVDTLFWSPLLFPKRPYHRIGKQYKIVSDQELNNPLLDAKLAKDLFFEEIAAFDSLDDRLKFVYYFLLFDKKEFKDFFEYIQYEVDTDKYKTDIFLDSSVRELILSLFGTRICQNADIDRYIIKYPIELAYSLAIVNADDKYSITPPWVLKHYPKVENILFLLRNNKCKQGCDYCNQKMDTLKALQRYFGFDEFRTFDGDSLQQDAVERAVGGKSLLAVFPTGGGKSVTFQLPAFMSGEAVKGLTVVISPLQSLMKDQVDNLEKKGLTDAATVYSALDPIEQTVAYEKVESGVASLLYISPEKLRSKSIQTLLLKRTVVRFVIDEAHCLSSWGQDFRVDYLYIAEFIKMYQELKNCDPIPVSCFTATAKPKVIEDICGYFKQKLDLDLEVFKGSVARKNLTYSVFCYSSDDKYNQLRQLVQLYDCPTIVYVSRTKTAQELATRLQDDGIVGGVVYYHGQMDTQERKENQEKFMADQARVIVATTAFGMGIDKEDVGVVIHYDISQSIEDYVQEAGRAGRNENINAQCFVLFDEEDLNKHFVLLNQSKLDIKEIKQVWKAIKKLTKLRQSITKSALEIAKEAGWEENIKDLETRVKTAIAALEQSGFVKRLQNSPRIFANSLLVKNMQEANQKIYSSQNLTDSNQREQATRIVQSLLSAKHNRGGKLQNDGESRVDYLSDRLGIPKEQILTIINSLRSDNVLADNRDLVAYVKKHRTNAIYSMLDEFLKIERFVIQHIGVDTKRINLKELNKACQAVVPSTTVSKLKTVFNYCAVKQLIKRIPSDKDEITVSANYEREYLQNRYQKHSEIAKFVLKYLFDKSESKTDSEEQTLEFSCVQLKDEYEKGDILGNKVSHKELDDALYYLSKIGAIRLEGAFMISYNGMQLERLESTERQYIKEDYKQLSEFYSNKVQQIHIVGEYANKMIQDYTQALQFVDDYFKLNYASFLDKYFKQRKTEISKNITPKKFKQLFGDLSATQANIVKDSESKYTVVIAGPGSGKTKVLVHKLASLYLLEDIRSDQMLALTFSRAAANEFRVRLMKKEMLGTAANFIGGGTHGEGITTFHSYCFDLLGQIGNKDDVKDIIQTAVSKIDAGEVEQSKITKSVLVLDEAQDMSIKEFSLVKALIKANEDLRVIAVGDDDQNIYGFRDSDSKYLQYLLDGYNAKKYELLDNYRSAKNIVALANTFVKRLTNRLKSTDIHAVSKQDGRVTITKYVSANLTIPLVQSICNQELVGTTSVLCETNETAEIVAGYLLDNGVDARLIEDSGNFDITNLLEVQYFLQQLNIYNLHTIDRDVWQKAKSNTKNKYAHSTILPYVQNFTDTFEKLNSNTTMYKSDFLNFLQESKLEDFCPIPNSNQIVVSTIHKAKGREFDNVFLLLQQQIKNDEDIRKIYVAITRAKQNLYIHTNTNCFDNIRVDGVHKVFDQYAYDLPDKLTMFVSYHGVFLSGFYKCESVVDTLSCGDTLSIDCKQGKYVACKGGKVAINFSTKQLEKIQVLVDKGYTPVKAMVRQIVFWNDKEQGLPNTKVVFPNVLFVKDDKAKTSQLQIWQMLQ